ncbi:MAG: hypothetical protein MZV65_00755 [Chromatiales bacterium]|nr:hypothetical protein [Chromatiales bacterium]
MTALNLAALKKEVERLAGNARGARPFALVQRLPGDPPLDDAALPLAAFTLIQDFGPEGPEIEEPR